jgi:hypothetical protein
MAREQPFAYPLPGTKPGGHDDGLTPVSAVRRSEIRVSRPAWLQAVADAIFGDLRPAGAWDDEGPMLGCTLDMAGGPYGGTSWFGSVTDRDIAPMPAEVIKPIAMLGYNPIPLETPRYFRGSLWQADDGWERGT